MFWGYIVMCLIFGTSNIMITIGLEEGVPPFWFAGTRFMLAGLLVLVYLLLRRQFPVLSWREAGEIALQSFLMTTIPFAALFWGQQHISPGTAALLVTTAPIFTVLFGVFFKEIRFRWYLIGGLLLSISGVALIVSHRLSGETDGELALISKLMIIMSELFFAIGVIRSRKSLTTLPPIAFNGVQMVFGSLGLLLVAALTERFDTSMLTWTSFSAVLYLVIVVSIVASSLYYWLVREINSTFPTTWTYIAPVLAMIGSSLFLGEKISWISIQGAIAVLTGVVLLNWETWREMYRQVARQNLMTVPAIPEPNSKRSTP